MVDAGSIASVMMSLKTASDIVKTVVDLRDGRIAQEKAIELNAVILAAQGGALAAQRYQSEMVVRISELEKEITRLEEWNTEAGRYELKQIDVSAFAYMPKPNADGSEPPHWLCQKCFEHKVKSVIQPQGRMPDRNYAKHACPNCKMSFVTYYARRPSVPYVAPA